MINNETVVAAGLFGVIAVLTKQSMIAILVGAIAVGVVQSFLRVLWSNKLQQEIKKNKSNYVQIELRKYEGNKYIDVREFYDAEDDKRLPTKKSITFSPKVLEEVIDGLTMLNEQIT